MAYAADKLYNDVIRKNMGVLVSNVKAIDMVAYLPCLTNSDREEIMAKKDYSGNFNAMMLLLDYLRKRENWPGHFISALQQCEQPSLANMISDAYDKIKGIHTPSVPAPDPAAAAVAAPIPAPSPAEPSATSHKSPCSTSPFLTLPVKSPAQTSTPSMNSSPRTHPNIAATDSADSHAVVSAPAATVHKPPKSPQPPEALLSVIAPDVRPPSPGSAPTLTPSVVQREVPVNARETSTLGISDGLTNAGLSGPASLAPSLPTKLTCPEMNNPAGTSQSSALPQQVPVAVSTSVTHPVQDTNPPGTVLAMGPQNQATINQVGERVGSSFSPNCQTQERSQRTAVAPSLSTSDAVAGCLPNFAAENEEIFSKPGILREGEVSISSDISLQISEITTESSLICPARSQTVSNSVEEPVSVTDNVTISSSTTVPSQWVSDRSVVVQNSTPRVFDNGFSEGNNGSYLHQPVEDHYESLQTRGHIVEFSEDPSVQNLSGQPSSMVGQTTMDLGLKSGAEDLVQSGQQISMCIQRNVASEEASRAANITTYSEPTQATFLESESNVTNRLNSPRSDSREEYQGVLHQFQSNYHFIAAAAFGMAAVCLALRLKH